MGQVFDAIVVGAGYIGSSIAYHLCSAGLRTAIFDQGPLAAGASAANYGNIQVQDMELTKSVAMTQMGQTFFATLEDELDWKIGLRQIGGLLPIENENQWAILQKRQAALQQIGIASELILTKNLQEIEPYLNLNNLLGALYHAEEGQIDPFQLIWGYIHRAKQKGLKEFYYTKVTGFDLQNNQIRGIKTAKGNFSAKNVILCTGAHTRRLGQILDRNWNVHYVLGQAMVTEPVNLIIRNHIASASFFEEGAQVKKGTIIANMAISQSVHGHILVGEAMYEADHFKTHVPAASLPAITNCWLRYFPFLKKLRVLRSWSAAVADAGDGLPFLGPVAGLEGLYIATAFRSTVIITPLVGKTMAQLLTTGKSDLDISSFLPERNINETN
jgi:sarcosine oxidase subunit beta